MAKDYLNRQERETFAAMLLVHGSMEHFIKHNEKYMTGQERKFGKMAMAFMLKFYGHTIARLGVKEDEKVRALATNERLAFSSRSVIDTKNLIVMDEDAFGYLAEGILQGFCKSCKKDADGIHACKVREVLLTADVPAADPYEGCLYRMSQEVVR